MAEKRANLGASVRAKLLNQARASGQPFDLVLVRFALERLPYRLSISGHAERETSAGRPVDRVLPLLAVIIRQSPRGR